MDGYWEDMNMKQTVKMRITALLLAGLMLLVLGGWAPFPENQSATTVEVQTVDELIAAIGPNVTVALQPGQYDLASAASYGKDTGNPCCRWEQSSEQGYELCISSADGLTLRGAGTEATTLLAEDRYANVVTFAGCQNVTVSGITAGHNPAPGYCTGGVLNLTNCTAFTVESCGLFGCGTMGVCATNCSDVIVANSRIYECSSNAVCADGCKNVQVLDTEIDHNGWKNEDGGAYSLFQLSGGDGFIVSGCRVHDNTASLLLQANYSRNVWFLSSKVEYNTLASAFALYEQPATVDGCVFYNNNVYSWYAMGEGVYTCTARDMEGKELTEDDLTGMTLRAIELTDLEAVAVQEPAQVAPGEEITVTTVDEFLAAIGPNRTIVLDGENFSLADATDYGSPTGWYYRWEECYDGPQLVISNVSNLTIRAASKEAGTTLSAVPRYANVLSFRGCDGLTISGLTLGHSLGMGECSGGVLDLEGCDGVTVESCRLYGCGTLGVNAWYCIDLALTDCEVYDCSYGGVVVGSVYGLTFQDCRIHDVPSPALSNYGCFGVSWNGTPVEGEHYDVTDDGQLVPARLG